MEAIAIQPSFADFYHQGEHLMAEVRALREQLNGLYARDEAVRPAIQRPEDAVEAVREIRLLDHEELWVLDLDTRGHLMSVTPLYRGTLNEADVRVAEVFRRAVIENAASIIMVHNHPGGEPSPSAADLALFKALGEAGRLLDIKLLDCIVVAAAGFESLERQYQSQNRS
jgi:DNA repair protein RadC